MNLKIILFVLILVIIPISNAYPTVDYVIGEENKSTPTPTSTIPSTPTNTESNIIIIIDASGSTGERSPSPISLIGANALFIIRNTGCSRVGIVEFGGQIKKTNLLPLCEEENKNVLENFLKTIVPNRNIPVINDLDKGLLSAEELLNSVNGTKEMIVLSDGLINPRVLSQTKNTIIDLKRKDIRMQFIQVLLPEQARIPNDNYDILAKTASTDVVLLYADERMTFLEPTPTTTPISTVSPKSTFYPIPTITVNALQLEQEVKELKERLNKVEENQQKSRKSWFESLIDWIKSIF